MAKPYARDLPERMVRAPLALRRALTAKLFGGAHRGTMSDIDVPQVLFALVKTLLR